MAQSTFQAQPSESPFDPRTTALVMIDMRRDFIKAGGFGEAPGNDVSLVRAAIAPCTEVLAIVRQKGIMVVRTREGHRADLNDCPPAKLTRGEKTLTGEPGPVGRTLVKGKTGHDIIPELYPVTDEPVVDRPGKGAFYQTDLHLILQNHGIKTLIVCDVTAEVYVTATMREANDRGCECIIPEDCIGSYFPELQEYTLEMIRAQGAVFDWVTDSRATIAGLEG